MDTLKSLILGKPRTKTPTRKVKIEIPSASVADPFIGKKTFTNNDIKLSLNRFQPTTLAFRDTEYVSITLDEVKTFLRQTTVDEYVFKPETFDCDNFSLVLMSTASLWAKDLVKVPAEFSLGVIQGKFMLPKRRMDTCHMMNLFISSDKVAYLIEPQTDEVFPLSSLMPDSRIDFVWI